MGIRATTRLVGVIGWPVAHSVSPAMHNAAFAALGLDWAYVPLPVEPRTPRTVREAVLGLRGLGLRGANVTVPHKQAVMEALDTLSPEAEAMGAVNVIVVNEDGSLRGENTDSAGFAADLEARRVQVAGAEVMVLGAGGSARAVVHALARGGAASITIVNRSHERAEALIASAAGRAPGVRFEALPYPEGIRDAARASLVVNCTSIGMLPQVDALAWDPEVRFRPGQVVYDLVYAPEETRLLAHAAGQGARAIGGLGMLIRQGALAFTLWTGRTAPVQVMEAAARAHFAQVHERELHERKSSHG